MIYMDYDFHHTPEPISWEVYRGGNGVRVFIDRCRQSDGLLLFAVRNSHGECLSIEGSWHHELIPLERTVDNWLEIHRFKTLENAWEKAVVAAQNAVLDYKELVDLANVSTREP